MLWAALHIFAETCVDYCWCDIWFTYMLYFHRILTCSSVNLLWIYWSSFTLCVFINDFHWTSYKDVFKLFMVGGFTDLFIFVSPELLLVSLMTAATSSRFIRHPQLSTSGAVTSSHVTGHPQRIRDGDVIPRHRVSTARLGGVSTSSRAIGHPQRIWGGDIIPRHRACSVHSRPRRHSAS